MRAIFKPFLGAGLVAAMLWAGAGPVLAGPYTDGRAAFDDGDYAKAIQLLEPLAKKGDGLAEAFLGLSFEAGGDQHDDASATLWLLRAAQSGAVISGKIMSFDCGDNCYLTIAANGFQETALCVAPECEPWIADMQLPAGMVGRKVSAVIGIGERQMGDGSFVDYVLSFRTLKVAK